MPTSGGGLPPEGGRLCRKTEIRLELQFSTRVHHTASASIVGWHGVTRQLLSSLPAVNRFVVALSGDERSHLVVLSQELAVRAVPQQRLLLYAARCGLRLLFFASGHGRPMPPVAPVFACSRGFLAIYRTLRDPVLEGGACVQNNKLGSTGQRVLRWPARVT